MIHETNENRRRERLIAEAVARKYELEQRKLSDALYGIDRVFFKDVTDIRFFAEVKERDWNFGDGDGLNLGLGKWMNGKRLAAATGKATHFIGLFTGGVLAAADMAAADRSRPFIWGRMDRPLEEGAIEPSLSIPWAAFVVLDIDLDLGEAAAA